jgi:predicted nucleotidyltransferase
MNRDAAIAILRKHREALQARGVRHAALFGSAARGTARRKSDIDILIDLDPSMRIGVFAYSGLKQYISDLFEGRADVADRNSLKPHVRGAAEIDATYAF